MQVCNATENLPFIEMLRKTAMQYYPDNIDVCMTAIRIPGMSMAYFWRKIRSFSYIHKEASVTCVKKNKNVTNVMQ